MGDLQSLRERDVLAVTALDQQAFNQSLLADSPYRPVDNVLSVREPDLWQKVQRQLTAATGLPPASTPIATFRRAAPGAGSSAIARRGIPPAWWWWRWPAMMTSWRD